MPIILLLLMVPVLMFQTAELQERPHVGRGVAVPHLGVFVALLTRTLLMPVFLPTFCVTVFGGERESGSPAQPAVPASA